MHLTYRTGTGEGEGILNKTTHTSAFDIPGTTT